MPRRVAAKPAAIPAPKTTPLKRPTPASNNTPNTTPRASKRLKSSPLPKSTTPKRSKYFSHPPSSSSEPESEIANEESGYEDEDASASAVSSPPSSSNDDDDDEDEYASDEETSRPTKRKRGRPSNGATGKPAKGQELWRPGVKTGLGPGKQVFIALPKARGEGGVRYADDRIHPNTMLFLAELKANNDREWLKVHDADYRQAKLDFDTFVASLTEKLIEVDDTIPELPPKDLTFRIYRDVRFSPDQTPYKTHFSAAFSRTGRKGPYASYYLQLAPSASFLGAGIWHPDAHPLSLLRRAIDTRAHELETILTAPGLRAEFLGGERPGGKGQKGEKGQKGGKLEKGTKAKEVVEAFVRANAEGALKTRPKGYEATNPQLPLLRLRNYTIGRGLGDGEVVGEGGVERVVGLVGRLVPFVRWLNGVVMPDEGEGDEEGEGEGDEEGEGEEGEGGGDGEGEVEEDGEEDGEGDGEED